MHFSPTSLSAYSECLRAKLQVKLTAQYEKVFSFRDPDFALSSPAALPLGLAGASVPRPSVIPSDADNFWFRPHSHATT